MKLPRKEHAKVYLPLAAPNATRAVNTNGSFKGGVRMDLNSDSILDSPLKKPL